MTGDEFRKDLEKGRCSAEAVNLALVKLTSTGGKYAEGAIAQSDTLFGKLSTLQDAFIRLGQNIGKALDPIFKFLIDQTTRLVNAINDIFARNAAINAVREREGKGRSRAALGRFMGSEEGRAAVEAELARQRAAGGTTAGTGLPDPNAKPPELLGGTGGASGAGKERVDISEKLLALNKELFDSDTQLTELQRLGLEFQIEKQEILDRNLLPREEEVALLKAAAGFEQDLVGYREEQIKLQQEAAKQSADAIKAMEEAEQRRLEADPGFQMKQQLEELLELENQVAAGATAIGNAFSNALVSVVNGSKSADEALADMMASVAEHFLDMAAKIIAQQLAMILYGTIMKALGVSMGGGGAQMSSTNYFDPQTGLGVAGPNFGLAEGAYVSGPTNALIGEGGEPEYVIPESKMRESMARYSRGARGGSVIPESGEGGTTGEGGGAAVAAPIDVRFSVERINNVDYVTAEEFQIGMQKAASQGAQRGQQLALTRLQQSPNTRRRLGL